MSNPLKRQRTDLPVEDFVDEITDAIGNGSLVLTAEPGAGKSSIVPLLAAAAVAEEAAPRVLVLEPRRLAARATAQRLAELLNAELGGVVGLTMRGERRVSNRTVIEVMTEAVLTTRLQRDPELPGVGVIVFDEFHERNLHSDLGLAMALEARATIRPDLRLVVMSATLNTEPVSALLDTTQVIEVPGRTFPVETVNLARPSSSGWADAVAAAVDQALAEVDGDVLVFVPGRREITDVSRRIEGAGRARPGPTVEVIGLHGGSDGDAQRRALAGTRGSGPGPRRVIVATSVAETSVTLPGIEAVVDGGLLRRARFDPGTGLGRLETRHVTRFSADQRRGRAGRLGPGRCYRLWSSEDHRLLDDAVPPEIVDGDPLPITFELARWGDPDGRDIPLLDHPGEARLEAGRRLLVDLGLLDDEGSLTARGTTAGALGVHPRVAALLLAADELDLLDLGATVAALLDDDRWPTTPDLAAEVEQRWSELQRRADQLRRRLRTGNNKGSGQSDRGRNDGGGRRQLAELGTLLVAAWPDRIAAPRSSRPDQFLLASGREGFVDANGPLGSAEFLVVAEADGEARRARIRRAVAIDRATLHDAAGGRIMWTESVVWDDRDEKVRAERRQGIGAVVLHREPWPDPRPEMVADALATGLRRIGLDLLTWSDKALAIRHRLAWLHEVDPDGWPDVDDGALVDRIDEWLDLTRCSTAQDVAKLGVGSSLLSLLDWRQQAAFDEAAPVEINLPDGRSRRLSYATGRPVLAARIQHLFGLDTHPRIGPRQTPVTIELLSPAGRPAQVTTDLPGFWRGSYAAVRRDLRGRYPKHAWPEEPWQTVG